MLEEFDVSTMRVQLHTAFNADLADKDTVALELTEVNDLGSTESREQFSLIFKGPRATFLAQAMYRVVHEELGGFDLFIVPVGEQVDGYRYEAVMNRLKPSAS